MGERIVDFEWRIADVSSLLLDINIEFFSLEPREEELASRMRSTAGGGLPRGEMEERLRVVCNLTATSARA